MGKPVVGEVATTKKPAKAEVSDAEFRRRLKNISEWRKKRLARFAPKIRVEVYIPLRYEPAYQDTLTWLNEEFTELRGGDQIEIVNDGFQGRQVFRILRERR
jgi:hypothetical protein